METTRNEILRRLSTELDADHGEHGPGPVGRDDRDEWMAFAQTDPGVKRERKPCERSFAYFGIQVLVQVLDILQKESGYIVDGREIRVAPPLIPWNDI